MIRTALPSAAVARGNVRPLEAADRTVRVADELVSLIDPASAAADQYRTLRTSIDTLRKQSGLQVLGVTSPTPGDGKTVTTLNLAGTLAQAEHARILAIDGDLRKPSVDRYLHIDRRPPIGLVNALRDGTSQLADVAQHFSAFNLSVVPAGRPESSPYELLHSPHLDELMRQARRDYDFILVDTPPAVMLPDCRLIDRVVDGFILVIAAHKTPRRLVAEALGAIGEARVLGVVFNGDDRPAQRYYGSYGRYGEGSRAWWRNVIGPS